MSNMLWLVRKNASIRLRGWFLMFYLKTFWNISIAIAGWCCSIPLCSKKVERKTSEKRTKKKPIIDLQIANHIYTISIRTTANKYIKHLLQFTQNCTLIDNVSISVASENWLQTNFDTSNKYVTKLSQHVSTDFQTFTRISFAKYVQKFSVFVQEFCFTVSWEDQLKFWPKYCRTIQKLGNCYWKIFEKFYCFVKTFNFV